MAPKAITRRESLRLLAAGLAALASGCTPLRIALNDYPKRFREDDSLREGVLRAFAVTVIPGADPQEADLIRVLQDGYYPFHRYCAYFAADLCARSAKQGVSDFSRATASIRSAAILDGLSSDRTTRKLYHGAILLVQISYYAGIYDDRAGCKLIDFRGRYRVIPRDQIVYRDPEIYLARPTTADGNPA